MEHARLLHVVHGVLQMIPIGYKTSNEKERQLLLLLLDYVE